MVCFSFWCWESTDVQDILPLSSPAELEMSQLELQTVPVLGKETISPSQKEFPSLDTLTWPRRKRRWRREEPVFFLFLWRKKQVCWAAGCQAQGELRFLGWGALGWHSRVPATHKAQQNLFRSYLIDPHLLLWTVLAGAYVKASTSSEVCWGNIFCTICGYFRASKHTDLGAICVYGGEILGADKRIMHILALPGTSETTGAKELPCYLQSPHIFNKNPSDSL